MNLKLWQNSQTYLVTKLTNSNYDKTQNSNFDKTQKLKIVTKLNLWQNLICDKTQIVIKRELWQNSNCAKLKMWRKNSSVTKFNCDKTWELQWCQNSKTQMMTKLKNSNHDKTWNMTNLNFRRKTTMKGYFSFKKLTRWRWWDVLWAAFCDYRDAFCLLKHVTFENVHKGPICRHWSLPLDTVSIFQCL